MVGRSSQLDHRYVFFSSECDIVADDLSCSNFRKPGRKLILCCHSRKMLVNPFARTYMTFAEYLVTHRRWSCYRPTLSRLYPDFCYVTVTPLW